MDIKVKRILILIGSFKIGGAEKMSISIGEELLKRGYDVHFALQKPIFQIPNNIDSNRIHVLNYDKFSNKYLHHINNLIKISFLRVKLRSQVVIGLTYYSSFLGCFSFSRNVIATFDVNPYILGKKRQRIADFVCKWPFVRKIVAPSKGTVQELMQARPKFSFKFKNIYNSLEFDSVEELGVISLSENEISELGHYIVAMGRLSHQKNFSLLIEAFSKSNISEKYNLVIIGDGPLVQKLKDKIDEVNLSDKVKLLGFKSNPYPYIKNSEFLVNTSNFESFCVVILEALALGKPVIATDCKSGPGEMIINGHNGFLVPVGDEKSLVEKLDKLSNNRHIIKKLANEAQKSVSKFKITEIGDEWEKLLANLFKDK